MGSVWCWGHSTHPQGFPVGTGDSQCPRGLDPKWDRNALEEMALHSISEQEGLSFSKDPTLGTQLEGDLGRKGRGGACRSHGDGGVSSAHVHAWPVVTAVPAWGGVGWDRPCPAGA